MECRFRSQYAYALLLLHHPGHLCRLFHYTSISNVYRIFIIMLISSTLIGIAGNDLADLVQRDGGVLPRDEFVPELRPLVLKEACRVAREEPTCTAIGALQRRAPRSRVAAVRRRRRAARLWPACRASVPCGARQVLASGDSHEGATPPNAAPGTDAGGAPTG